MIVFFYPNSLKKLKKTVKRELKVRFRENLISRIGKMMKIRENKVCE